MFHALHPPHIQATRQASRRCKPAVMPADCNDAERSRQHACQRLPKGGCAIRTKVGLKRKSQTQHCTGPGGAGGSMLELQPCALPCDLVAVGPQWLASPLQAANGRALQLAESRGSPQYLDARQQPRLVSSASPFGERAFKRVCDVAGRCCAIRSHGAGDDAGEQDV